MKINNIDIKFNLADKKDFNKFNDAFIEVSYKAKKLEDKFQNNEISKEDFERKQIKVIKKFFKTITTEEKAQDLFETCTNFKDYFTIFQKATQMCNATVMLYSCLKSVKNSNPKKKAQKKKTCK